MFNKYYRCISCLIIAAICILLCGCSSPTISRFSEEDFVNQFHNEVNSLGVEVELEDIDYYWSKNIFGEKYIECMIFNCKSIEPIVFDCSFTIEGRPSNSGINFDGEQSEFYCYNNYIFQLKKYIAKEFSECPFNKENNILYIADAQDYIYDSQQHIIDLYEEILGRNYSNIIGDTYMTYYFPHYDIDSGWHSSFSIRFNFSDFHDNDVERTKDIIRDLIIDAAFKQGDKSNVEINCSTEREDITKITVKECTPIDSK